MYIPLLDTNPCHTDSHIVRNGPYLDEQKDYCDDNY